jgi:beta-lactam-binding protein with PASTA domain
MAAAVSKYGGNDFPPPGAAATRVSTITVPDLTGKDAAQSLDILTGLGFDAQDGGERDSTQPAGTVAATDPAAGSSVPTGSTVTVYRSSGHTKPTPTPTSTPSSGAGAGG